MSRLILRRFYYLEKILQGCNNKSVYNFFYLLIRGSCISLIFKVILYFIEFWNIYLYLNSRFELSLANYQNLM